MYWKKQTGTVPQQSAVKVVWDANETIGHIPNGLTRVIEAEMAEHPCDAAERKLTLGGRIEVPLQVLWSQKE